MKSWSSAVNNWARNNFGNGDSSNSPSSGLIAKMDALRLAGERL